MPLRFVNGPTFYCSLVSCSNLNTHNALCASGSCAVFAGQWNIPEPCVQRTGSHSHYFVPHALPLHCTYPSGRHHISQWPFKVVSEFSFSIEVELCVSTCQSLQDFAILWFCKFKDFPQLQCLLLSHGISAFQISPWIHKCHDWIVNTCHLQCVASVSHTFPRPRSVSP